MAIKNLVIVESPAKAKTITTYLNGNRNLRHMGKFKVMASMGHVRDLKGRELSVDIEHDFKPEYEVLKEKVKLVDELKQKAASVENVFLAADYDREGEAICQHLKDTLGLKKYYRITFTEITPQALEKAILSPRLIDDKLVDAQETRRILDRLVGFKVSPLLWKTYNANKIHLSAGRVQSAVLHLIREKEDEIRAFQSLPYWYFLGKFTLDFTNESHTMADVRLYDNDRVYKIDSDEATARVCLGRIENKFTVSDLKLRQIKQTADLPFITSTLQQESYSKLGLPLKRTMAVAQDLYEKGYITYMRTDSYNISDDFKQSAEAFITSEYGASYYEGTSQRKSKTSKNAQEAHEAIRPTNVNKLVIEELGFTADHKKVYELIWKRTVAYFMKAALFDELEIRISDSGLPKTSYFLASFKKTKFNGFLILYGVDIDTYDFNKYITAIKNKAYKVTCEEVIARNTYTSPPVRYNEATIIKTLEAESIGRPSTFTTILTKLFEKHYVLKSDIRGIDVKATHFILEPNKTMSLVTKSEILTIGHERNRLVPSEIGTTIDDFMEKHFNYIIDRKFTATMEDDLDKIADGSVTKLQMLTSFWKVFGQDIHRIETVKKAEKEERVKLNNRQLTFTVNGIEYIVRLTKYGPVIQFQNGNDTKYIDIRMYLKYHGKSYTSVTEEDIKFVTSLPKRYAKDVYLTMGPYGLYFKYVNENVKIPLKLIKRIVNGDALTSDEIQYVLNAHAAKMKAKTEAKAKRLSAKNAKTTKSVRK